MDPTNKTECTSAFLKSEKSKKNNTNTTRNIGITLWNFKYRVLFADFILACNHVSLSLTSTLLRQS